PAALLPIIRAKSVAILGSNWYHSTLTDYFDCESLASSPGSDSPMPKNEHVEPPLPEIVGTAPAMQEVYRLVRVAAPRPTTVLLVGETGTGKEVIAKAIHKLSKR